MKTCRRHCTPKTMYDKNLSLPNDLKKRKDKQKFCYKNFKWLHISTLKTFGVKYKERKKPQTLLKMSQIYQLKVDIFQEKLRKDSMITKLNMKVTGMHIS